MHDDAPGRGSRAACTLGRPRLWGRRPDGGFIGRRSSDDIELSRSRAYAVDEGEQEIGVRCFAVPVPDAPTLTAISISGPATRLSLKSATKVAPLLKRVARDIASEFDKEAAG